MRNSEIEWRSISIRKAEEVESKKEWNEPALVEILRNMWQDKPILVKIDGICNKMNTSSSKYYGICNKTNLSSSR